MQGGGTIYFTRKTDLAAIGDHLARGGRAVFVREGEIVCREGTVEPIVCDLDDVPLTHGGLIGFQVENALAAVAAAWGLNLPWDLVREALASFASDMQMCPGRFNLLKIGGATVVVDYGHNPSALVALIDAIGEMPHERRIAVYSAAGDRRDADMIRQGELLDDAFDVVILYEDHYLRGRNPGEIIRLFREGVDRGSRVDEVHDLQGATKSLQKALQIARPGDLLLLQADCIDETMEFMRRYLAEQSPGREVNLLEALTALSAAVIPIL